MTLGETLETDFTSLIGSVIALYINEQGAQGAALEVLVEIDVHRAIACRITPNDRGR